MKRGVYSDATLLCQLGKGIQLVGVTAYVRF
jgi:hypothetical protein